MRSLTYGEVSFERMCHIIKSFISKDTDKKYEVTVGTDSQNFDITRTVIVVAVWRVGSGGIFFYDTKLIKKITNLQQKIFYETSLSIETAKILEGALKDDNLSCDVTIHVDVGPRGKTSQLIPDIRAWVNSYGFKCKTKPDSYTASCIANRYSK
jgi:uncharacterized protein